MKAIKICGLSRIEDIEYVNEYKPEYIGFVFAKSSRQVTMEQAKQLKKLLNPLIKAVGVFVDEKITNIIEIIKNGCIDIIQLHGKEDHQYIKELKKQTNLPIIKAISLEETTVLDFDVEYYLLDSKVPGSGRSFDWSTIKEINTPFFLAGGISMDNLQEALLVNSYGIDISSGVETEGKKDRKKIEAVIGEIRNGKR